MSFLTEKFDLREMKLIASTSFFSANAAVVLEAPDKIGENKFAFEFHLLFPQSRQITTSQK